MDPPPTGAGAQTADAGQTALNWVKDTYGPGMAGRVRSRLSSARPSADDVCWALFGEQADVASEDLEALSQFGQKPCSSRIRRRKT